MVYVGFPANFNKDQFNIKHQAHLISFEDKQLHSDNKCSKLVKAMIRKMIRKKKTVFITLQCETL